MNFCVVTRKWSVHCKADRLGNVAQYQRTHRHFAVLKKTCLAVNDLCDTRRMVWENAAARS